MITLSFCYRWTISEDYMAVFLPFSLDLNLAEYINRQIRILRSGCQENIVILNLTAFVVFKSLPKTKSVDMVSKRMREQSGK